MKFNKIYIAVTLLLAFMLIAAFNPASGAIVEDKSFTIYTGDGASHDDVSDFVDTYGPKNTVVNSSEIDLTTSLNDTVDALLLPGVEGFSTAQIDAITTWYELGSKLLWVAGDSDYGGYFDATTVNPLLKSLGTVLRLDAGAVDDTVHNDGNSGYRVVTTGKGDGPITKAVTEGMDNVTMIFHGPTSVFYMDGDVRKDLRGADVENVEVIITSSPDATVIDQDVTLGDDDFYLGQTTTGNYPMLAVEVMNKSMVVVSGEAVFTSYKFMYGDQFEKSGNPHVGKELVDNLITYYFNEVDATPSDAETLPLSTFGVLSALAFTTVFIVRRRK